MKNILRLLLWEACDRDCEGCCNKQWDLDALPVAQDFTGYDEIILTGGEPMLSPARVMDAIRLIRKDAPETPIYMYTANVVDRITVYEILGHIQGRTVPLHAQNDVQPFLMFDSYLTFCAYPFERTSLRLNVFKDILGYGTCKMDWKVKRDIEWIENCPLPQGETFMRLEDQ